KYLPLLPEGGGWLIVELGCGTRQEAVAQAQQLMEALRKGREPPHMKLLVDEQEQKKLWLVRESGLGATAFVPGEKDTWPGWEDSAVAPEKTGAYLRDLRALFTRFGYHPSLYGHFGQGCVHCRVDFDLVTAEGIQNYRGFMEAATDLVVRYGGSFSGEHGDGQSRAEFLPKMFGPEIVQAFSEFKSIWDPDWKMNPGKVVQPYRIDENLRLGSDYNPWEPKTHFKFSDDHGSFARAALRCVGVGKCRRMEAKGEEDTMCPSFMVTREEKDTTRGRAHALWEMLHGDVIANGWRDEHVKEALDLCLSCKGCKGDCPVNVDMATYKAEFLSHYWQGRLRPRHAFAFGWIDKWARLASLAPGFANLFTQLPGLRSLAKAAAGMPAQRAIPAFAPQTFKSWFSTRGSGNGRASKVILWADTFNNYFFPETAVAAVEVLESAGHSVEVPLRHLCCGRPLYDYGFLTMAESYLKRVLHALGPAIDAGTPMVVLEPSCCSVFRDELTNLFPNDPRAKRLKEQTFTLAEFLERNQFVPSPVRAHGLLHGHCHHKAIMHLDPEQSLLKKAGVDYELLPSGCCGMAGSFGFEKEKYDVSVAAGERVLLPAVRNAEAGTLVIADGFSCREQISQSTNRRALHTAEVLAMAGRNPGALGQRYPERRITVPRIRRQRLSMLRAALLTLGAAGIAWLALRSRSPRNERRRF
ncbi:MAG TPA: FAD-linked oxidase C-terminal domain-containing protein, partial [Terriglobales bacterium]